MGIAQHHQYRAGSYHRCFVVGSKRSLHGRAELKQAVTPLRSSALGRSALTLVGAKPFRMSYMARHQGPPDACSLINLAW